MALQTIPLWIHLHPDGTTPVQHPVAALRNLLKHVYPGSSGHGVIRPGLFAASAVPSQMAASVTAGAALVTGSSALQGSYFAYSEASEQLTWPAPPGSQARVDTLLLRIRDPEFGTVAAAEADWDIVQGVVAASPVARPDSDFNSGGAFYVPGAWLRVLDWRVDAGATQLAAGNVTWRAPYLYTPSRCKLRQTAAQSIPNNSWTAVTFTTEDWDYHSEHSTSTNTSRFTASQNGIYEFGGMVSFAGDATGRRGAGWRKNGAQLDASATLLNSGVSANVYIPAPTMELSLVAGDYIELEAYQASGIALNTQVGGNAQPYMVVKYLGPVT